MAQLTLRQSVKGICKIGGCRLSFILGGNKQLLRQHVKLARKLAGYLGPVATMAGYMVLVLRLPGDQSKLGAIGACLFLSGVLLTSLAFPRPSLVQLIWIASMTSILVISMMRPRWMGLAFLAPYLLAIILRAPQGLTLLRRAYSHWRQTIRELDAASRDEALPH